MRIKRKMIFFILLGTLIIIFLLICIYDYNKSYFHYSEYRPTVPLDSLIDIGHLKYLPQKISPFNGSVYRDFENGQNELKGSYLKGKKHGFWEKWYKNGQKKGEANYKNGNKIGKYITWYENGQIENENYYALEKKYKKDRIKIGGIGSIELVLLFLIISIIVFIVFYTKKEKSIETNATEQIELGKFRFVLTPLLLSIITFGIYGLVWLYKIYNEMLNHTGDRSISPGKAIAFLFIPILNIFWGIYLVFHVPDLIKNMEMDDKIPMSKQTNAGVIGICGIIPIINIIWAPLVQNALNRHWKRHMAET